MCITGDVNSESVSFDYFLEISRKCTWMWRSYIQLIEIQSTQCYKESNLINLNFTLPSFSSYSFLPPFFSSCFPYNLPSVLSSIFYLVFIILLFSHADGKQRKILEENYGQHNAKKVEKVKKLYSELHLEDSFKKYEEESYAAIQVDFWCISLSWFNFLFECIEVSTQSIKSWILYLTYSDALSACAIF